MAHFSALPPQSAGPAPVPINTRWYCDFFRGITVDFWRRAIPPQHTAAEVELAVSHLRLKPGCRVLDLACGHGRHSIELVRHGCRVIAIDISADALAMARQVAEAARMDIDWRHADLAELAEFPTADAAIMLGNGFGYFPPSEMAQFVQKVAAALPPGGRWLFDTGMTAESVIPHLRPQFEHRDGDLTIRITNRYLTDLSCLESTMEFTSTTGTQTVRFWHWIFTVGEIGRMLAAAGLAPIAHFSDTAGTPYEVGSPYLYLVAEKE